MRPLPFIGDDNASAAYDINEKSQVVGISNGRSKAYGARAFLYENGTMMDLNGLVQGDSSLYLFLAQGINDRGEIVGTAIDASGGQVGFLAGSLHCAGRGSGKTSLTHPHRKSLKSNL